MKAKALRQVQDPYHGLAAPAFIEPMECLAVAKLAEVCQVKFRLEIRREFTGGKMETQSSFSEAMESPRRGGRKPADESRADELRERLLKIQIGRAHV